MKSKNMLNSVYGMSATDPIHQEIDYNGGDYTRSGYDTMTPEEIEKALKGAAFPYQWGVYTTAYARQQLQKAIKLCRDKIIYCDTDSVKTLGDVPIHLLNDDVKNIYNKIENSLKDIDVENLEIENNENNQNEVRINLNNININELIENSESFMKLKNKLTYSTLSISFVVILNIILLTAIIIGLIIVLTIEK